MKDVLANKKDAFKKLRELKLPHVKDWLYSLSVTTSNTRARDNMLSARAAALKDTFKGENGGVLDNWKKRVAITALLNPDGLKEKAPNTVKALRQLRESEEGKRTLEWLQRANERNS